VGVTMQQAPRATDRRGSLLVRRSIMPASAQDDADASSSSGGGWQPQDSILEVEPSAASAPGGSSWKATDSKGLFPGFAEIASSSSGAWQPPDITLEVLPGATSKTKFATFGADCRVCRA
jgi:hypothetical protein